ncbi:MAG: hypothetical protein L0Y54_00145, partial [Sporichthyaceae bacterium]|nr:hypothetical protein [Sporichthyaceae bacterium]
MSSIADARTLVDPGAFAGLVLKNFVLNPKSDQSLLFIIAGNTADVVVIQPITTLDGDILNLRDVPELGPGSTYRVMPPWSQGGAGGAGSSVHCAGSSKSGIPYRLPDWTPGAGGGGGGGAARFECGGIFSVTATGRLRAEGGAGGYTSGNPANAASNGGGGGGGTILIQAGTSVRVTNGGLISAAGGPGAQLGLPVGGGQGGGGRLRFENAAGDLLVTAFDDLTDPPIVPSSLGTFFGGTASLAQSLYLASGVLVPIYTGIRINYQFEFADTPDVVRKGTYELDADGIVVSEGF